TRTSATRHIHVGDTPTFPPPLSPSRPRANTPPLVTSLPSAPPPHPSLPSFSLSRSLYSRVRSPGKKSSSDPAAMSSNGCLELTTICMQQEKGVPLPKFGDWDVNNPASAEGFTVIFNKARDEKKTTGTSGASSSPQWKNGGGYGQDPNYVEPRKSVRLLWL
ncbi:hypothetical protein Taro_007980, partial [Colocasia esculenta]|nr:hypothetical protein [Colocasia esculenta]